MADPTKVSYLRRKLGAKLRRMREKAGYTLAGAAPKLDRTTSALHRVETGETKADVHLVKSMMDLYNTFVPTLLDETRKAAKRPWFHAHGVKGGRYLGVETEAFELNEFSAQVVPGLLQTEDYMRALFLARRRDRPFDLDRAVKIRLIRQRRLTSDDNPLSLVCVIDEAALLRPVGGPEVMREQLEHLLLVSELPTVTVQVLPLSCGAHHAMPGSFLVLRFPDPEDPEYLCIEHLTSSVHSDDIDEVRKAKVAFTEVQSAALSPADSIALIERMLEASPWTTRY